MKFRGGEFSTGTMGNFQPELTRGAPSIRSPACSRGSRSLSDGMPDEVHTKYKNENLPVFGAEKKLGEHIQFSPASGPGRSDLTNRTPYTTIVSTL